MRRLAVVLILTLVICGVSRPAAAQPTNCSTTSQNLYVREVLNQYYLWYRNLPNLNPTDYNSPEAYLEAVRYRPLDTSFSYVTSRAANDAFYSDSQFIGFGLSTMTTTSEMRVLQVFDDSPASEAGLARGDRILEINSRRVADLIASGEIANAFGPTELGVRSTVLFQSRAGVQRRETMIKRLVTIPTVSLTRVVKVKGGRMVGYVFFRNFVRPSYEALDAAFAALKTAGVTELVLDLRYNGGGLVDVAVHLASLIGGGDTNNQVFAEFRHNDRQTRLNETLRFRNPAQALRLSRLIVIATRSSASASELIINSLRPFIPVFVIGDRTYGKPVGQYGFEFCDKVLAPVSFSLLNANGQGDYFDGIAANCMAADDIEHDLGAVDERSLAEALHFIRTGACSSPSDAAAAMRAPITPRSATGWQSVVNAY